MTLVIRVGCAEILEGHRLIEFDDLSAKFEWWSSREGVRMESPIVQGCPYVTFFFTDATPRLTSRAAIASDFQGVYTGDVFRVPLNNGQTWMIYASKNITFNFKYSTFADQHCGSS